MSGKLQGRRPHGPRVWWLRPLAVAAAYYALGRLVWLVTGSPGHAIPLWPPAGITLAAMLLTRDLSLCTGATLGGFGLILHATLSGASGLGMGRAAAVSAMVGVAVSLEPLAAAVLARRATTRLPSGLGQARTVVRFALLAGPAPAALGATLATAALIWAGLVPLSQALRQVLLWWVGDMLGLVVFGPLGLVLGARLSDIPWRRRITVAVPVILVTALSVAVFVRASRWDRRRGDAVVRERAEALTGAVERSLVYNLDALRTAADYLGSARVDPESFRRVATGTVVRHFAFSALAWAPAPGDGKAVPVDLVDPGTADPRLAGTDLAADAARQAALSAARHSGESVVLEAPPDGRALWVFVPAPGRTGDNGVSGFVGGLLRVDYLVDRAVSGMDRHGIGLELHDGINAVMHRLPPEGPTGTSEDAAALQALPGAARFSISDRTFTVVPVVSPAILAVERSGEAWIVLVVGMLLVALLQGVLMVVTRAGDDAEDTLVEAEWPSSYQSNVEATSPSR
jgi:integral membrane sensor domain MASE1